MTILQLQSIINSSSSSKFKSHYASESEKTADKRDIETTKLLGKFGSPLIDYGLNDHTNLHHELSDKQTITVIIE
jgi:hypothetical protein